MQGFERIPDAIDPLIGYRAWFFSVEHHGASPFPIGNPDPSGWSAWNGANDRWVSAACTLDQRQVPPESVKRCLERIRSKLGYPPGRLPVVSVLPIVPHTVPGDRCSCGFYAMKALETVMEPQLGDVILGRVELAGKVIECTDGYRAERARITQLTPVAGTEQQAMRLANRLGLPLTAPIAPWFVRGRHIWRD